jgi:hypothetical protein
MGPALLGFNFGSFRSRDMCGTRAVPDGLGRPLTAADAQQDCGLR